MVVLQLVDFHVTRTLARAQWDILGFGPYASLPRERRMEVRPATRERVLFADREVERIMCWCGMQVMERIVDRYLSIRIPIRRYEFMTQIQVQSLRLSWPA